MDLFAEIADERRALADQLADLTPQQQTTPSLCSAWTVHDVLAHLVMPLEVSVPKVVLAVLLSRGDFDRANQRVTRTLAKRSFEDLRRTLHAGAAARFTPPGSGPEAPLVDVLVHGRTCAGPSLGSTPSRRPAHGRRWSSSPRHRGGSCRRVR